MPYIGNQPAEQFTSFATQTFSVSATTSYTLDHAVTNENEIALFVNNVRQQPGSGKAYTATGTALTLSAATASTDTMYCVFLGRALQTVNPAGGSVGSSQLSADAITGQTALTSAPASTDELLISDAGVLKRIDVSLVGGANTPAFSAYSSGNISITNATETTVVFDSEYYDSASAYNVSDGKFTPQTAGKYFISYAYTLDSGQDSNLQYAYGYIEKNTTNLLYTKLDHRGNAGRSAIINGSVIVDMNGSSDFIRIQLYVYADITGSGFIIEPRGTFSGFKIIE